MAEKQIKVADKQPEVFKKEKGGMQSIFDKPGLLRMVALLAAMLVSRGVAAYSFELPDGTATCSEVSVRRDADPNSTAFWKIRKGEKVKVKAINGEWYKIKLEKEKEGYVHNTCLDVFVWAKVLNTGAWIHKTPAPTADVIGDLRDTSWVRLTDRWQTWYQVTLSDKRTQGWVEQSSLQVPAEFFSAWLTLAHVSPLAPENSAPFRSKYLEETGKSGASALRRGPSMSAYSNNYNYSNLSSRRVEIISYARTFLGTPYNYGGNLPSTGFDCSGFVNYVFKNFGVKLQRASSMMAEQGQYVNPSELLPGDLVFFGRSSSSSVNHVGIYIGGGDFIHCSSSNKGSYVRISPLFDGHYRERFIVARRIIPE